MAADVQKILIGWLRDQTGQRAADEVPPDYPGDEDPAPLFIQVDELPGPGESVPGNDICLIDIHVYGPDRQSTWDLAMRIRELVSYHLIGQLFEEGATWFRRVEASRPSRLPYPGGAIRVVTATYRFTVHNTAA